MTPRVLLVDDRPGVRKTLRNVLSNFKCALDEAESGAVALAVLATHRFDVVFLDLMLPDQSGLEVMRKHAANGNSNEKFIVLTGLPDGRTRREALDLGAFRYLTKSPIDARAVREAFTQAVYGGSAAPAAVLKVPVSRTRVPKDPPVRRRRKPNASLPKLLILDDREDWLLTLERLLERDFRVTLTTSADEACRRARTGEFALVILDMNLLEGVSGLDVLARMRRSVPDLRAIVLTENPDPVAAFESGKQGVLDFVSKSDIATLGATITRVLARAAQSVKVFISYDRRDSTQALKLYDRLTAKGLLPWIAERNIEGGRKWRPEIERAIAMTDFFVFCLSGHSRNKEGMIRRELNQALDRQAELLDDAIFIVTARLEPDIDPPDVLTAFHYVDLFERDGFANLLRAFEAARQRR